MNIDYVKAQASRLASFLGTHHRFSLKRASALEAVAHMYGAKNWQTLLATLCDEAQAEASTSTAASTKGPQGRTDWLTSRGLDARHVRLTGTPDKRWRWIADALGDHMDQARYGIFLGVPDAWKPLLDAAGVRALLAPVGPLLSVDRKVLQVVYEQDLAALDNSQLRQALLELFAAADVRMPFTVAALCEQARDALPNALFERGRGSNLQVLAAYGLTDSMPSAVLANSFTEVALELDSAREAELLRRAHAAAEVRFTSDQGARVVGWSR